MVRIPAKATQTSNLTARILSTRRSQSLVNGPIVLGTYLIDAQTWNT